MENFRHGTGLPPLGDGKKSHEINRTNIKKTSKIIAR
jgi:hypothetical protein